MWRKIKINISPDDFQEHQWETIKVKVNKVEPQYLSPKQKAHLV